MRALVAVLFLTACSAPTPAPDRARVCCTECRDGAGKDPQARDLSLLDCAGYAATDSCRDWFATHPTFVQDCR